MKELDGLIEEIRSRETEKVEEAKRIRKEATCTVFSDGGAKEDEFLQDVTPDPLDDLTVGGVDGGLVQKAFHGVDLIMVRAVAALLSYEDGGLADHTYLPSKRPRPQMEYRTDSIDRSTADRLASLCRLQREVDVAQNALEHEDHDMDALFLDGALLPQYADKPGNGSELREQYDALIDAYKSLYDTADEQGVMLAGIVEDTRSSNLCSLLQENGFSSTVLETCRDSHLLSYLLNTGERTLLMAYSDSDRHPVLSDLRGYGHSIYSFYLKTVKNDRPLRIDIYAPRKPRQVAETVAAYTYALSGAGNSYGVPTVIIEADKRAKLDKQEVERIKRIQDQLPHLSGMDDLRRDSRPF